eukprot:12412730-Karenia_brevis.AAC.1
MLQRLYNGQRAKVQCDVDSKEFKIGRGVKQGDPISPMLFTAVLEKVMRKLKARWTSERKGIRVGTGSQDVLQNLRFADDLLLVGASLEQVSKMLEDLMTEAAVCGLAVHMGKTKILCNGIGPKTKTKDVCIGSDK